MAKLIKKFKSGAILWEAEEGDPIYSEGWTLGAVTQVKPVERKKSKDIDDEATHREHVPPSDT